MFRSPTSAVLWQPSMSSISAISWETRMAFEKGCSLTRQQARDLLAAGDGKHWKLAPAKGKHGRALTVLPLGSNQDGGEKGSAPEGAKTEGADGHTSRRPHEQATARNDSDETGVSPACDGSALVAANPKCSADELTSEGSPLVNDGASNGERKPHARRRGLGSGRRSLPPGGRDGQGQAPGTKPEHTLPPFSQNAFTALNVGCSTICVRAAP